MLCCKASQCLFLRWLPLLSCICALVSTFIFVISTRSQYTDLGKNPYTALVKAVCTNSGGFAVASVVQREKARTWLSAVSQSQVRFSADANNSFAARSGIVVRDRYRLESVDCAWSTGGWPSSPSFSLHTIRWHSFFIHGSAGGSSQGQFWSCALALQAMYSTGKETAPVDSYTFHFGEEANAHRGLLICRQADFVADTLEKVFRNVDVGVARNLMATDTHKAWLVGHSMGGIVARVAALLVDLSTVPLLGVLTFNSPHTFPPLFLDRPMRDVYEALRMASLAPEKSDDNDDSKKGVKDNVTPLSSKLLIAGCARGDHQRCAMLLSKRRSLALFSLSSGEMDLQIETATASILSSSDDKRCSRRPGSVAKHFYVTQDKHVCGHSNSHDGVLRDACAMHFASALVVNLDVDVLFASTVLLSLPHDERLSVPILASWGRYCWLGHLWGVAVCTLVLYILLQAVIPLYIEDSKSIKILPTVVANSRHRAQQTKEFAVRVGTKALEASPVLQCGGLFYSAQVAQLSAHYISCLRTAEGCCEDSEYSLWHLPALPPLGQYGWLARMLLSLAPFSVGLVAAMSVVGFARSVQRLSPHIPYYLSRISFSRPFIHVLLLYVVMTFLLAASVSTRALGWLALSLLYLLFSRPTNEDCGLPPVHLSTSLYALIHAMQLQPFFTIRNAVVSGTFDDWSSVDGGVYVTEASLMILLMLHKNATRPSSGGTGERHKVNFFLVRKALSDGCFNIVKGACLLTAFVGLATFAAFSPVEFCNTTWLLLCVLPTLLFWTAFLPSRA